MESFILNNVRTRGWRERQNIENVVLNNIRSHKYNNITSDNNE